MIVNNHGQIIGDDGIIWRRYRTSFYSVEPVGYFIEPVGKTWEVFRKNKSSYPPVPFVRQVIGTGSILQCMCIAEIYQIKRTT